jgi:TonB family protein
MPHGNAPEIEWHDAACWGEGKVILDTHQRPRPGGISESSAAGPWICFPDGSSTPRNWWTTLAMRLLLHGCQSLRGADMRNMFLVALGCGLITVAAAPASDALSKGIAECSIIKGNRERLECYDSLARSHGLQGPQDVPTEPGVDVSVPDDMLEQPLYAGFGGVSNPEVIPSTRVQPKYPDKARKAKISGQVTLQVVVKKDGSVGDIQILGSPGSKFGFDEAAVAAVKQWRFKPGMQNGKPVDVYFTIVVDVEEGPSAHSDRP